MTSHGPLVAAGLVNERGQPTAAGHDRLADLVSAIAIVRIGHSDNTGAPCRVDLDGHDCCYVCNVVEAALRGALSP